MTTFKKIIIALAMLITVAMVVILAMIMEVVRKNGKSDADNDEQDEDHEDGDDDESYTFVLNSYLSRGHRGCNDKRLPSKTN